MGEGEVGAEVMNNGLETNVSSRIGLKRDHQGDLEEAEPGVFSNKKQAKEASNDDLRSEVSNPNSFSPRETFSSFQPINSDPAEQPGSSHIGCGDLSSTCSGNSGTGNLESLESSGEEDHSRNNTTGATSISHVILEIPKYATSTGVRKVTFKFRKSKEDCEDNLTSSISTLSETAVSNWPAHVKVDEDHQRDPLSITRSTTVHPTKSGKYSNKPAINMELQMPKKVAADIFPTNVKKFLSTGILEGARVKYISPSEEKILHGIICGCGYLCGCSACSFLKVVTAYEFEVHAGGKTRHPNNHIYLENGMPIYSIIQKLRTVPLSILDEVVKDLAGSAVNEERFQVWKDRFQQNKGMVEVHTSASHLHQRSPSWHIEDTTHTISTSRVQSFFEQHVHMKEKSEDRKRRVKKKKKFILDADIQHKRTAEGVTRKRDNDLHRLLFMPNGLPDGADLGYYIKGQRILRGYKQGNGIVCSCCDREISPSQFEAHAGWAARRQPYRHIYISNGLTLHDIAISLANGQKLTTGDSDDMCALCGDGGDMIFCGGCPRAFHAACLGQERATEGNWHCPHCKDKSGPGIKAPTADSSGTGKPIVIRLTQLVKVPEYQSGGCVFCRNYNFSSDKFDNQTVLLCDQCEREFHVGCLRERGFCDLKELPKEKWFCCEDCSMIHSGLQNLVSTGVDAIPASLANALKWNHIESRCADVSLNDVQWQILSGKSRIPEHLPVLSRATAIFRECFTPIIAKSGRDLIPVMVYGRNISGQEFGGMYCIVLIVKSVVVSAGLLRIFGREVAELPLVATSQEYQRKGYFQALFSCIEGLLSSLNVENLVLPSAEDAELLWTKKLGFQKMSEEQLLKYTKEIQLTMFKGTSMLQKVVPRRRTAA